MLEIKDLYAGVIVTNEFANGNAGVDTNVNKVSNNTNSNVSGLSDRQSSDDQNAIDYKEILKGINLTIKPGEIHAIMGQNGSGKSSLAYTLAGHPKYIVKSGDIKFNLKNLLNLDVEERAKEGLFLSLQYPTEISAITLSNFLRTAKNSLDGESTSPIKLLKSIHKNMENLKINKDFLMRPLNVGYSGGEKKKNEILQLEVFKPKLAILDEIDSGLDIDALKIVSEGINRSHEENNTAIVLITHYNRLLKYVKPDFVHIFADGKIIKTGDIELANELEKNGYDFVMKNL